MECTGRKRARRSRSTSRKTSGAAADSGYVPPDETTRPAARLCPRGPPDGGGSSPDCGPAREGSLRHHRRPAGDGRAFLGAVVPELPRRADARRLGEVHQRQSGREGGFHQHLAQGPGPAAAAHRGRARRAAQPGPAQSPEPLAAGRGPDEYFPRPAGHRIPTTWVYRAGKLRVAFNYGEIRFPVLQQMVDDARAEWKH